MRIGIIGAGMIGGTLARRLAQLGNDVAIANSRGPETLTALASETGARAVRIGRPVVKAFNDIFFKSLLEKGAPRGSEGRVAIPVAGDEAAAKAKIMQLIEELGFDAIDA